MFPRVAAIVHHGGAGTTTAAARAGVRCRTPRGTARTGRNLGYDMIVLRDGSGSRSRENHDLALKLMERMYLDVVTAAEVAAVWRR